MDTKYEWYVLHTRRNGNWDVVGKDYCLIVFVIVFVRTKSITVIIMMLLLHNQFHPAMLIPTWKKDKLFLILASLPVAK